MRAVREPPARDALAREEPRPPDRGPDSRASLRAWRNAELAGHVRELVAAAVSPGSTVLVVSKGDGELLKLPDRVGWHFPQDERGVYAGTGLSASSEPFEFTAAVMNT